MIGAVARFALKHWFATAAVGAGAYAYRNEIGDAAKKEGHELAQDPRGHIQRRADQVSDATHALGQTIDNTRRTVEGAAGTAKSLVSPSGDSDNDGDGFFKNILKGKFLEAGKDLLSGSWMKLGAIGAALMFFIPKMFGGDDKKPSEGGFGMGSALTMAGVALAGFLAYKHFMPDAPAHGTTGPLAAAHPELDHDMV